MFHTPIVLLWAVIALAPQKGQQVQATPDVDGGPCACFAKSALGGHVGAEDIGKVGGVCAKTAPISFDSGHLKGGAVHTGPETATPASATFSTVVCAEQECCHGHGVCVDKGLCQCENGWSGTLCDQKLDLSGDVECDWFCETTTPANVAGIDETAWAPHGKEVFASANHQHGTDCPFVHVCISCPIRGTCHGHCTQRMDGSDSDDPFCGCDKGWHGAYCNIQDTNAVTEESLNNPTPTGNFQTATTDIAATLTSTSEPDSGNDLCECAFFQNGAGVPSTCAFVCGIRKTPYISSRRCRNSVGLCAIESEGVMVPFCRCLAGIFSLCAASETGACLLQVCPMFRMIDINADVNAAANPVSATSSDYAFEYGCIYITCTDFKNGCHGWRYFYDDGSIINACESGWSGDLCNVRACIPPCIHGTCSESAQCQCDIGWQGPTCASPVCNPPCANGGTCSAPNTCVCSTGWSGPTCTIAVCSSPCQHGGTCSAPNTCVCSTGWSGPTCTIAVCSSPCQHGGTCVSPNQCVCVEGWTGPYCENKILPSCQPNVTYSYQVNISSIANTTENISSLQSVSPFAANVSLTLKIDCLNISTDNASQFTVLTASVIAISCSISNETHADEKCKAIVETLRNISTVFFTQYATTGQLIDVVYNQTQEESVAFLVSVMEAVDITAATSSLGKTVSFLAASRRLEGRLLRHSITLLAADKEGATCYRHEAKSTDAIEFESESTERAFCTSPTGFVANSTSQASSLLGESVVTHYVKNVLALNSENFGDQVAVVTEFGAILVCQPSQSGWIARNSASGSLTAAISSCAHLPFIFYVTDNGGLGWTFQDAALTSIPTPFPVFTIDCDAGNSSSDIVTLFASEANGTLYSAQCQREGATGLNCSQALWVIVSTNGMDILSVQSVGLPDWPLIVNGVEGPFLAKLTGDPLSPSGNLLLITTPIIDYSSFSVYEPSSAFFTAAIACATYTAEPIVLAADHSHQVVAAKWNATMSIFNATAIINNISVAQIFAYPQTSSISCAGNSALFLILLVNGTVIDLEVSGDGNEVHWAPLVDNVYMLTPVISGDVSGGNHTAVTFYGQLAEGSMLMLRRTSLASGWNTAQVQPLPLPPPSVTSSLDTGLPSIGAESSHSALLLSQKMMSNDEVAALTRAALFAYHSARKNAYNFDSVVKSGRAENIELLEIPAGYVQKPFCSGDWLKSPPPPAMLVPLLCHAIADQPLNESLIRNLSSTIGGLGVDGVMAFASTLVNGSIDFSLDENGTVAAALFCAVCNVPTSISAAVSDFLAAVVGNVTWPGQQSAFVWINTTRIVAIQQCINVRNISGALMGNLTQLANDTSSEYSGYAAAALGALANKLEASQKWATEESNFIDHSRIHAISAQGSKDAVALLGKNMHRHPPRSHAFVGTALGLANSAHESALPHAKRLLKSPDASMRSLGVRILQHQSASAMAKHYGSHFLHTTALYDKDVFVRRHALAAIAARAEVDVSHLNMLYKSLLRPHHPYKWSDLDGLSHVFEAYEKKLHKSGKPSAVSSLVHTSASRVKWLKRMYSAWQAKSLNTSQNRSDSEAADEQPISDSISTAPIDWRYEMGGDNGRVTTFVSVIFELDVAGAIFDAAAGLTGTFFGYNVDLITAGVTGYWGSSGTYVATVYLSVFSWDPINGQQPYYVFLQQWRGDAGVGITLGNPCIAAPPKGIVSRSLSYHAAFFTATAFYGIPLIADVSLSLSLEGDIYLGYGITLVFRDLSELPSLLGYASPAASVSARASADVRVLIASGSVAGNLVFASLALPAGFGFNINHKTFAWQLDAQLTFLSGSLSLNYEVWGCGWDGWWPACGGSHNWRGSYTLVDWPGYVFNQNILSHPACSSSTMVAAHHLDIFHAHAQPSMNRLVIDNCAHYNLCDQKDMVNALPFVIPADAIDAMREQHLHGHQDKPAPDSPAGVLVWFELPQAIDVWDMLRYDDKYWNPFWLPIAIVELADENAKSSEDLTSSTVYIVAIDCDASRNVLTPTLQSACPSTYRVLVIDSSILDTNILQFVGDLPFYIDPTMSYVKGIHHKVGISEHVLAKYTSIAAWLNVTKKDEGWLKFNKSAYRYLTTDQQSYSLATQPYFDRLADMWSFLSNSIVAATQPFTLDCNNYEEVCYNTRCYIYGHNPGNYKPNQDFEDTYMLCSNALQRDANSDGGFGNKANRQLSLAELDTVSKKDRDEFPMNCMATGGCFARIMAIDPSQNRRHGGSFGNFFRGQWGQNVCFPGTIVIPGCTNQACMPTDNGCKMSDERCVQGRTYASKACELISGTKKRRKVQCPSYWEKCADKC